MASKSYSLTLGAQRAIKSLLILPGWAKTPLDIYNGGSLAAGIDSRDSEFAPKTDETPFEHNARATALIQSVSDLEITDGQREAIRLSLKKLLADGKAPATSDIFEIVDKLGLKDE